MNYVAEYSPDAPERSELDALPGIAVVEFGVDWCPHCQGAQAAIATALGEFPPVRHVKVEDGPGRRLGRSYRVKLWPTLIVLRNGLEIARIVRPSAADEIRPALLIAAGQA